MELQTLQEALKVEIQVHQKLVAQMKQDPQNAELKKQLHELQAKITALSEKQKKVVEQLRKDLLLKPEQPELKAWVEPALPDGKDSALGSKQGLPPQPALSTQQTVTVTSVLSTKAVPLVLKAANPTMPVSIVAQRPTVNMVTTIGNMAQSNVINTDSQNAPINLQTSAKVTNQGLSKNAVMVQATSTAQPIRVPQFTPPPRLMPRPSCLPQQVRPRSITPNVPIAPAPPAMMPPPQLLQRPLMLTAKMTGASLPSTSSPIHQVRIVNGQPCATLAKTLPSCQLTGIVITTPADPSHLTSPQTLQIASLVTDTKTVKNQGGTNQKAVNTSSSPTPPSVPKPNHEHDPQKRAFMVSLGLVTHHHLEEIQSRRQERKRRTTANPVYSGATFEPERKKSVVTYLNTPVSQTTRKRGRPPKYSSIVEPSPPPTTPPSSSHMAPSGSDQLQTRSSLCNTHPHPLPLHSPSSGEGDIHEDFCTVCRRSGQLLMCDTCSRVYHLDCLDPPLITIPKGMWICPKCQDQILKKEEAVPWPGTLAIVHSYIAYKAAKEEEKQKLLKWSAELKEEREQLEQRVKQLSSSITKCMETKNTILARQKEMQASLEKVKSLVHLIRSLDPPSTVGIVNGGMDCSSSCANVMDHSDSATVPSIETNAIKTVSDGTPKPSVETTAIKTVSDGLTEPCVETTTIGTMSDGTTEPCVKPAAIKTVSNGMTEPCTETTAIKTVSDGTTEPCTETTAIKSVTDGKTEPCTETTAIKTMSDGTTEPSTETTAIKTVSDGTTEPCTETTAIKTISDGTMDPCIETTAIKTTNKTVGDTKSGLSVETTAVKPASDGTEEVSTCEERDPHSSDSSRNSSSTTEPLQLSVPAPTNSMDRQK